MFKVLFVVFYGMQGGIGVRDLLPYFKALADDRRILIINLLLEKEYCVADLQEELQLSQAAVSHHLKILKQAGLLKDRASGTWTYYSLDRQGFAVCSHMLEENLFRHVAASDKKEGIQSTDRMARYRFRLLHWFLPLGLLLALGLGLLIKARLPFIGNYLRGLTFAKINLPLALSLFALIYSLFMQIELASIKESLEKLKPTIMFLVFNWLVKVLIVLLSGIFLIQLFNDKLVFPSIEYYPWLF